MSLVGDPDAGRSRRSEGRRAGPRAAGRDQGRAEGARANSRCRTGTRPARRRCATRCWCSRRPCPTSRRRSAPKSEVDPVRHLIGTAAGWGGNPDKDATYLNVTPAKNDGKTIYKLNVKDVPVDGFWSVSLYNAEGYFEKNPYDAYSLNNITAQEKRRRLDRHPVRRLRRQDSELPADHEGLELHGAALSAARRNPERQLEIPGAAASELKD